MEQTEQLRFIAELQKGNKEAFTPLYHEFIRPIYNFVYYKTHHKETAEDITSTVFTKAFTNIASFKSDKGPFSAWLYQIARNQIIDHYRAVKPTLDIEDAWGVGDESDIERDLDTKEQLAKVKTYLQGLSAEQRDIVIMRVWQEMSYAEIAAALGKSEASCKMMFSRTISKLREEIPAISLVLLLVGRVLR